MKPGNKKSFFLFLFCLRLSFSWLYRATGFFSVCSCRILIGVRVVGELHSSGVARRPSSKTFLNRVRVSLNPGLALVPLVQ
ncbi:hypothetical protein BDV40DRAFT_269913 [Aspergillus tamarii]|uniref:Uncharacterized protein n=1 Tax=Aspergillus tamarii TaxID=41984 RepID=A0A5N6UPW3_ASPTM|nr:hypothetical protein BDV40DRAFT_269913 [Aspergillus tamarii]